MTSRGAITYMIRGLRLQHRVPALLFLPVFALLLLSRAQGAEDAADPYDTLYDVIMTRFGPEGNAYAENETTPAIFNSSSFPFGDKTYTKLNAALDAFAALPQSKVQAYSDVQRALLQRHLWKLFDVALPIRWERRSATGEVRSFVRQRRNSGRREAAQPKIASLIRRLALPRERILALPDTLAATVKSGGFPQRHDPDNLLEPFLPGDPRSKDDSWVCLGEIGHSIPADAHSTKFRWRSAFLSFMRAPGGRAETLKCIEKINREDELPVGVQFALIEQAFLISDVGELVLSPLIVTMSLRAYVGVNPRESNGLPEATQCLAEFVLRPRQLMQRNAVMEALGPREHRFEAGGSQSPEGAVSDPFELRASPVGFRSRLSFCRSCHVGASRISVRRSGVKTARVHVLKEDSPEEIIEATLSRKREDYTWETLRRLWREDSARRGTHSQAVKDPYEALYDAIMLRQSVDGKVHGYDEVTPLVYGRSEFPFDPVSFARFDAALKEFESLPQETIEAYSDIQRAILQRHLWVVFDATIPRPDSVERKPNPNRDKPTARIASLMRRLALSKEKIRALPQTGLATVRSGKFREEHDASDPFSPFLPADLFSQSSSWVGFGRSDQPAAQHARFKYWRSAFFQLVRTPGSRESTIATIKGIHRGDVFPVGTQFALIERAFLISDEAEIILSPLVYGIELRAYLDVERSYHEANPSPTQCVTEFVLQPQKLLRGNAVMKPIERNEVRWKAFSPGDRGKLDPIELGATRLEPRIRQCMNCHGKAGLHSLGDFLGREKFKLAPLRRADVTQATITAKLQDSRWTTLEKLWRSSASR